MTKPMLAKTFKASWLKFPICLQPKLDGMRATWTGEELLSRTGKEIVSVPKLVEYLKEHYSDFPLDGELYVHGKSLQRLLSKLRRTKNIEEDMESQYHIYDLPVPVLNFTERHALLKSRVIETDRIKIVRTDLISCKEDCPTELNRFEVLDYEGTIVRNSAGLYKSGRSSNLLKIKSFEDAEFKVIGKYQLERHEKIVTDEWVPGARQKSNGQWSKDGIGTPDEMIGGLIIDLGNGKTCEVGTGFDDETRREYWVNPPIGKMATIKFQEWTDNNTSLRHPVFIAIRDYE